MQTSSMKRRKSGGTRAAVTGVVRRSTSWMAAQLVSYSLIVMTVYFIAVWRLS